MKATLQIILKGMVMGIAEVIPGVSGGTIAFITGIYERLLSSINAINFGLIKTFKQKGLKGVMEVVDGYFLLMLIVGMAAGIVLGVFGIAYFLDHYPTVVWGLFFGIIFASIFYIGAQINEWKWKSVLLVLGFTLLTLLVVSLQPANGSENLLYVFLAGFIAISALMLPGISGSFMLLIMGMYGFIVQTHLKNALSLDLSSLFIIGIFGLGCLTGLFSFAKLLHWTFNKYRNGTLAALTGILLGSLFKIWPWRNPIEYLDKLTGEIIPFNASNATEYIQNDHLKLLTESAVLPGQYFGDPHTTITIFAFVIGAFLVWILHRLDQ